MRAVKILLVGVMVLVAGCGNKSSEAMPSMPSSMKNPKQVAEFSSSTALVGESGSSTKQNGVSVPSSQVRSTPALVVPDGSGGVAIIQGKKVQPPKPGYMDAREIKLKIRELAEQLIAGIGSEAKGAIALPVSFVNMDKLDQTSSFGRLITEQLMYEFNQRGFPVREYRISDRIQMREGEGDFYLSREMVEIAANTACNIIVAGTYYADKEAMFVNARIIRPSDGRILRTANLVLQPNGLTRRMLANTGMKKEEGRLGIRDFKEATQPAVGQNPIDQGADIH